MADETEPIGLKDRVRRLREGVQIYLRRRKRERAAKKKGGSRRLAVALTTALVVLLGMFGWSLVYLFSSNVEGRQITLDEVQKLAEDGRITRATFLDLDNRVVGEFDVDPSPEPEKVTPVKPAKGASPVAVQPTYPSHISGDSPALNPDLRGKFWLAYPANGQTFQNLQTMFRISGASYKVDAQVPKQRVKQISTFLLPLMILANLFALLFSIGKSGGGAIGEVMTFGKIGKGKTTQGRASISFEDVGGADYAVAELREVRDYLSDPGKYEALGAAPPKGVLLFGPPGCGKTLLAKAVAGEAGVPFFSVAGAEFVESLVGVGAARVRDLFARVRAAAPAIVFIDELDAAGRKRGTGGGGGGSDEREQTLNQLLVEMDGFEVSQGIVVMGATNRPDILDPALMRPGRFDRHITIERPEHEGRVHILKIHSKGKPVGPDVDLDMIARRTPGFTGADLANVVNEATLLTIREYRDTVTAHDFDEAIQRVLDGPKRRGNVMSEEERQRTAFHESGHVIVAAVAGQLDELHRVSILARGRQLGTTQLRSDNEATVLSRTQLRGKLVTHMAGIAAEHLIFGEGSTGGEQDLEQATDLAREIVARYGMSDRLGPVRLLAKASEGFLGNDIPFADISTETQRQIDEEIRALVADAQAEAVALLSRHRETLDRLAHTLLDQETLEGAALLQVIGPIREEVATETISPTGKVASSSNGSRSTRRAPARTKS